MSRFFVGQRVRIKYSLTWPELDGTEGVIQGFDDGDLLVAPDSWGSEVCPYPDIDTEQYFAPYPEQVEPLLPEGSMPSEFSFHELMDKLKESVNVNC